MNFFKKKSLVVAVIGTAVLSLGLAGNANAGAKAYSDLLISNFLITKGDTTQYDFADFDFLDIGNFSSTSAITTNNGGVIPNVILDTTAGGGNGDDNLSCVGTGCGGVIGEDEYFQQLAPVGSFARADTQLLGALITGLVGPSTVNASAVSEGQTSVTDDGQGDSSVGTGTEFRFNLASDDTITFDLDAVGMLEVLLHQDDVDAFASMAFAISIIDGSTGASIFNFAPGEINTARTQLNTGSTIYNTPGGLHYTTTTPLLDSSKNYVLSIEHRTRATFDAIKTTDVPEPGVLILLGTGLIGLSLVRRRSKADA